MALIGTEWLVLAAIVLIIFLFKPKAVTDLARSMGQVVAEFKKERRETRKTEKKEELLAETAERLGIKTEGKTPSQLKEEILAKARRDEN